MFGIPALEATAGGLAAMSLFDASSADAASALVRAALFSEEAVGPARLALRARGGALIEADVAAEVEEDISLVNNPRPMPDRPAGASAEEEAAAERAARSVGVRLTLRLPSGEGEGTGHGGGAWAADAAKRLSMAPSLARSAEGSGMQGLSPTMSAVGPFRRDTRDTAMVAVMEAYESQAALAGLSRGGGQHGGAPAAFGSRGGGCAFAAAARAARPAGGCAFAAAARAAGANAPGSPVCPWPAGGPGLGGRVAPPPVILGCGPADAGVGAGAGVGGSGPGWGGSGPRASVKAAAQLPGPVTEMFQSPGPAPPWFRPPSRENQAAPGGGAGKSPTAQLAAGGGALGSALAAAWISETSGEGQGGGGRGGAAASGGYPRMRGAGGGGAAVEDLWGSRAVGGGPSGPRPVDDRDSSTWMEWSAKTAWADPEGGGQSETQDWARAEAAAAEQRRSADVPRDGHTPPEPADAQYAGVREREQAEKLAALTGTPKAPAPRRSALSNRKRETPPPAGAAGAPQGEGAGLKMVVSAALAVSGVGALARERNNRKVVKSLHALSGKRSLERVRLVVLALLIVTSIIFIIAGAAAARAPHAHPTRRARLPPMSSRVALLGISRQRLRPRLIAPPLATTTP